MSQDPRKILGKNVRDRRLAVGLSQEELSERSGLHRTYISSLEHGDRNVGVENIFALALALGVDPESLLRASINEK